MKLEKSSESFNDLVQLFSYNKDLPLDIHENNIKQENDIFIRDINYNGIKKPVNAYLVSREENPIAGIIFVHPGPGNRSTFLKEAVKLARRNVLSILVEAPWANPDEFIKIAMEGLEKPEKYYDFLIKTTIDFRRAVDLMTSLSEGNIKRLGFVGHSFGALFGGILSGIEKRIENYILMAGVGSFTDVALLNVPDLKGETLEKFRKTIYPLDPVHYMSHAAPSNLFFQFGSGDNFFPKETFMNFYEAGSKPKSIKWYDSDHYLNEDAREDRIEWLTSKLGL